MTNKLLVVSGVIMAFSENLRRIRQEQKLTQSDVARAVGVWQTQIANIENGRSLPSMELAVRIADFLGVTLDDLSKSEPIPA